MTWEDIVTDAVAFFETDDEAFVDAIEALDSWDGYLGDDRVYYMEEINEIYTSDPLEAITRAFYGYDGDSRRSNDDGTEYKESFNQNKKYYYYNGYGNLVSTDYKDYSDKLDEYFIEDLYEHKDDIDLPDEIVELFDQREDEAPEVSDF